MAQWLRRRLQTDDDERTGWKEELRAALKESATDLQGVSRAEIAKTVKAYRRRRRKPELTVVAEPVEATV